ncbi:hypothetical protein A3C60_02200 [Candidatus Nomurabacteria bacterium RIFCSPHIGHO2_02_FULL_37_45]|uniref:VanZ-like domain-containing protein n=2 Tax=Candidatus Nomuraibacteriota TaxID=1752729 RepID=A0A1F6Y3C5_9BACT|nr:MAG: hypothetical protein A2727_00975 [Candidatus Nomurabacteria bacterium RIFCSPHIGHO2_01_FULL_37_110]OGI72352.1 MAG: hypothetical protein A3C60_02200 [Candidatus Nomurabacteria bacterium RIFCSPHIGHO2_02_FULL_37_45]OGI79234.1 MAG: hypothetical protein A3F19_02075 [Candidatus Nomurabacteria bacterium RIFCSPHIGHO2_12_FULL_37_29]OGI85090.1 MAG: hypothetical protein A3A92_01475 [Candidatus Nomurabacteria bacterium RIFCSPLOWO2_01_FULL_37_49]OGJ00799.1 MAG: hypothetical protein A3G98_01890 [Candi
MDRKKFFKRIVYLIFFIFIVHFFANKFYWYSSIWYFDIIMHFLGGLWVGLFFIWFSSESLRLSLAFKALTLVIFKILLFVFVVGFGWEVFEFLFNNYIAQNPFDFLDSTSDIFFDLVGGIVAILFFLKKTMLSNENKVK